MHENDGDDTRASNNDQDLRAQDKILVATLDELEINLKIILDIIEIYRKKRALR